MGLNVVNARSQCAHPGTPTVDARRCYHRDAARPLLMHEDAITEMIAECACARATWRMAPGRVKCTCSRNHVAQLSLHEEKRCSHRNRANFCCRGQFRFLAATEMSTQPDEMPPFTPEQHAWLLEAFGPGSSSETRNGTPHDTAPTGSNPEEGPPSQPPTFS